MSKSFLRSRGRTGPDKITTKKDSTAAAPNSKMSEYTITSDDSSDSSSTNSKSDSDSDNSTSTVSDQRSAQIKAVNSTVATQRNKSPKRVRVSRLVLFSIIALIFLTILTIFILECTKVTQCFSNSDDSATENSKFEGYHYVTKSNHGNSTDYSDIKKYSNGKPITVDLDRFPDLEKYPFILKNKSSSSTGSDSIDTCPKVNHVIDEKNHPISNTILSSINANDKTMVDNFIVTLKRHSQMIWDNLHDIEYNGGSKAGYHYIWWLFPTWYAGDSDPTKMKVKLPTSKLGMQYLFEKLKRTMVKVKVLKTGDSSDSDKSTLKHQIITMSVESCWCRMLQSTIRSQLAYKKELIGENDINKMKNTNYETTYEDSNILRYACPRNNRPFPSIDYNKIANFILHFQKTKITPITRICGSPKNDCPRKDSDVWSESESGGVPEWITDVATKLDWFAWERN